MNTKSLATDDALLLRELDAMLKTDYGRGRILRALPGIVLDYFDKADALRVLILRTMPYRQYLKTLHWRSVAASAKGRANGRCQLCNSAENLEAHHRTYERRGCEDTLDVTVLCDRCHKRFHKEPPPDEPDAQPKMSEAQEVQWLTELIERKRAEQGIVKTAEPSQLTPSLTIKASGTSSRA